MTGYILRRCIDAVIVLVIVSLIIFFAMRVLPGDPIYMLFSEEYLAGMSPEEIELLKHEFGLDKPLLLQYADWITTIFHGDLGKSLMRKTPVLQEISRRVPITVHLNFIATVISVLIGIPAGIICAIRRGKWVDTLVTTVANLGMAVPNFWLAFLLVFIFGLNLKLLPVYGYTSPFDDLLLNTKQIIMPIFCLSLIPISILTRQTRSAMLEVLRQDYIRTAMSKGLRERIVVVNHALKNGLIPVITLIGMQMPFLIGGSVIIETVFNIPGMGRLLVEGVLSHDYPVVQGVIMIISGIVVIVNILVDLSYGWVDPRIRYR